MTTTSTPTATVLAARRAEILEGITEDVDAIVSAITDLRAIGAQQYQRDLTPGVDFLNLGPIATYLAAQLYAAFPELEHSGTFRYPHGFDHQADLAAHDAGSPTS